MALLTYQVRSYTLVVGPSSTPTLIAPASASRRGLLLSGLGAAATDVAAVGPSTNVDASAGAAIGIIIDPAAGPLELCLETHGQLVQAPLYAVGSASNFRLTVIEFTGNVSNGGPQ